MVAKLKVKPDGYYCSNCMVRQLDVLPYCCFCGYEFSNWEEISYKIVMSEIEEEMRKNESNLSRKS